MEPTEHDLNEHFIRRRLCDAASIEMALQSGAFRGSGGDDCHIEEKETDHGGDEVVLLVSKNAQSIGHCSECPGGQGQLSQLIKKSERDARGNP
jgi:hypothetical protein